MQFGGVRDLKSPAVADQTSSPIARSSKVVNAGRHWDFDSFRASVSTAPKYTLQVQQSPTDYIIYRPDVNSLPCYFGEQRLCALADRAAPS
jgi:hypothetical protein